MVRSPGLRADDVRLIRSALVHAVAVARAGQAGDPPEQPPEGLRRVLGFRRLQTAALETVRRVLDSDEEFRRRVIEAVSEDELGRPGWLWLTRPEGWAEELAGLAAAAAQAVEDDADRDVTRLRRALAGAEEAARRREAAAERAQETGRRAQAELGEARAQRREAERVAAAARLEAERAGDERDAAEQSEQATAADLERARAELDNVRAALREAESELAVERAGNQIAPGSTGQPGGPEAPPEHAVDLGALGNRLHHAASDAAALAEALAEAADDLVATRTPGPERSPEPGPRSLRATGGRRGRMRRPAAMPPGVWDDAPEAAAHLVRLPGAVVLVDGYNVARTAWPSLTPEEERVRLIAALEELHARTGAEVTVVFDGIQEGAPMSGKGSRTVRVRFTAEGVSADDVVRDLVDRFPVQRPVVVVSSDREVADGARARGANAVSSRQFLTALGR